MVKEDGEAEEDMEVSRKIGAVVEVMLTKTIISSRPTLPPDDYISGTLDNNDN